MSSPMYTVSSLVRYLKQSIEHDMNVQSIMIKGEISNFTNHRSGHWYFTLKDAKAKLSCVMFATYASRSKILLKEGMKVIVSASLSVYEAQGSCQLYVTQVQVDGLGDLFLQYEQLKEKLALEGLFAPEHKQILPSYPVHIAIISAKEGAAIQDMLTTIARRWPLAEVHFFPSLVQGKDAPKAIIENLKKVEELQPDVVLLARGGGPIEDLWCFNDEELARFVYQMKTVVVSGVGHESDTTLVDYVSDARAATPTAAAELITPDRQEVQLQLTTIQNRLKKDIHQRLQQARQELQPFVRHRYMQDPISYIKDERLHLMMQIKALSGIRGIMTKQRHQLQLTSQSLAYAYADQNAVAKKMVDQLQVQLLANMQKLKQDKTQKFLSQTALLDAFSPLKILSRGYAITYKDGHIVKSSKDIACGDEVTLRMQDGKLHACIHRKEEIE